MGSFTFTSRGFACATGKGEKNVILKVFILGAVFDEFFLPQLIGYTDLLAMMS